MSPRDSQTQTTVALLRRYFVAGLIIVLPSVLTLYIVWILFGFVGGFVSPFMRVFLRNIVGEEILDPLVTLVSVLVTVGLIVLVGITATHVSQRMFEKAEAVLRRIPIVRGIYGSIRQIIDLVMVKDSAFQRVGMIEYPRKGIHSICFLTSRRRWDIPGRSDPAVTIFVPTSPNPTSGFFMLVPEKEVIFLDVSVDEAMKMIVSGGIIGPDRQLFVDPTPIGQEITW
ncbi:MAG: DUF502 domain-containing protein [Candidatus Methylomirabilales bacterium]